MGTLTARGADDVPLVEYLITAHQDAFKENGGELDADKYFNDSLAWLKDKHGEKNIISAVVHNDEQAPHLVVYVTPIIEKPAGTRKRSVIVGKAEDGSQIRETREFKTAAEIRLSAKTFFGSRKKLSDLQTSFADEVGIKHNLRRGVIGSRAKRKTIKAFYSNALEQVAAAEQRAADAERRAEQAERYRASLIEDVRGLVGGLVDALNALAIAARPPVPEKATDTALGAIKRVFEGLASRIPGLSDSIAAALEPSAAQADGAKPSQGLFNSLRAFAGRASDKAGKPRPK